MSRTQHLRAIATDERANPHEREAARRALAIHERKIQTAIPEPEPLPPGPELTKRGSPFRAKVDDDGRVWVAARAQKSGRVTVGPMATAEQWVAERRRMLVMLDGERLAMVPTEVEHDEDGQRVWVTADRESLTEW